MRLIDADTLRAEFPIPEDITDPNQALVHITGIWAEIDNAPTIEERKKGKAIVKSTGYRGYWACDQCGTEIKCTDNFCRHCGADLRGEK